jgi:hypothetical protein
VLMVVFGLRWLSSLHVADLLGHIMSSTPDRWLGYLCWQVVQAVELALVQPSPLLHKDALAGGSLENTLIPSWSSVCSTQT